MGCLRRSSWRIFSGLDRDVEECCVSVFGMSVVVMSPGVEHGAWHELVIL